ncbi:hypothetical protein C8Q80DRAFT_1190644 [Daedaleopsis nitida]|nr:hypothetical protein C8Q80DRAFT_1190644 [Daedaleopsis nitida]
MSLNLWSKVTTMKSRTWNARWDRMLISTVATNQPEQERDALLGAIFPGEDLLSLSSFPDEALGLYDLIPHRRILELRRGIPEGALAIAAMP